MSDPYLDLLDELRALTLKKRQGYSPGADPFWNFRQSEMFGVAPVKGIMIRVMDKLSRVKSLLENPENDVLGESLRDNLIDAGNYCLIAVAYMDQDKPTANIDARSAEILAEIEAERRARAAADPVGAGFYPLRDTLVEESMIEAFMGVFDSSDGDPGDADAPRIEVHDPDDCDVCLALRENFIGGIEDDPEEGLFEPDEKCCPYDDDCIMCVQPCPDCRVDCRCAAPVQMELPFDDEPGIDLYLCCDPGCTECDEDDGCEEDCPEHG